MDVGLAIAFWGVSMLFVLIPGADWAYAISSGISHRNRLIPAVSGMLFGHLCAALAVAAGVAAVLLTSSAAMTALTVAGSLYLIWLGLRSFGNKASPTRSSHEITSDARKLFGKGLGISLLNPKLFLLFIALLPQFVSIDALWPTGVQLAVLGLAHVLNCALIYFAVGYAAHSVLNSRPLAARCVTIVSGIVLVGLGLGLLLEKVVAIL